MKTKDRIVVLESEVRKLSRRISDLEQDCYIYTLYHSGSKGKKIPHAKSIGLILDHFGLDLRHYSSYGILKIEEREAPEPD